jgi:hypothetical protein
MQSEPPQGPVPASVRNAFLDLINDETEGQAACDLAARLLECNDVLPFEYCEILELAEGSTFAEAARQLRATLGCETA